MPTANMAVPVKYMWMDHDAAERESAPPVQNQWYEVFHAYDVRLIWFVTYQSNGEHLPKNMEVRWTVDGHVYLGSGANADAVSMWWFRTDYPAAAGATCIENLDTRENAAYYVDKRGHDFKAEVRMTSAPGTNQYSDTTAVYETLEQVAP